MAEDETGWSEKGKKAGRGKRPPRDSDALLESGADAAGSSDERIREGRSETPSRPSRREDTTSDNDRKGNVVRRPAAGGDGDGARKVARAAATAGQRDVSFVSRLGFPALVGLICLLGILAVGFAWTTREAKAEPRENIDHWHAVYAIWDCTQPAEDKYLPPFTSAQDVTGIHSHGDGLVHIHPFIELASGENARFEHFLNEMGVQITDDRISLDNGVELVEGTDCADGSGPAEIRMLRWRFDFEAYAENRPDPTNVYTEALDQVRFNQDREVFVIAFAAAGTDDEIPNPPQERLDALNGASAQLEYNPDADSLIPRDTGIEVEPLDGLDADAEVDAGTTDEEPAAE